MSSLHSPSTAPVAIDLATTPAAYTEMSSAEQMTADCRAVQRRLPDLSRAALVAPSLRFEDYPTETPKPEISVTAAAARLAGALHLHLD